VLFVLNAPHLPFIGLFIIRQATHWRNNFVLRSRCDKLKVTIFFTVMQGWFAPLLPAVALIFLFPSPVMHHGHFEMVGKAAGY
jgi:hypothetical protein